MGCRMPFKGHFLYSYLDFIPENLDEVSDEQGESLHQDITSMEHRYQGCWDDFVITDYCWSLYRDAPDIMHHRKRKSSYF